MTNSELQLIISKWLDDPFNEELRQELETGMKNDPESLASFKQLQIDFLSTTTDQIPENPFFFSKLKYKMEKGKEGKTQVQRVRWAIYAATMSVSIVMGLLLGNQVVGSSAISSDEEIFAEELLVEDYSIDNTLLLEVEE
jgi:hypothetical protein